jgi:hypothetical protein
VKPPSRAECQSQAEAAVLEWLDTFGLTSRYLWSFAFVRDYGEDKACVAQVDGDVHGNEVDVTFHECTKPEHYRLEAAHECLHVLFQPMERAIDHLWRLITCLNQHGHC